MCSVKNSYLSLCVSVGLSGCVYICLYKDGSLKLVPLFADIIEQALLPSKRDRRDLLYGFKASNVINVNLIEDITKN